MKINLNLYASFRSRLPEEALLNSGEIEVEEGATVGKILAQVNIAADDPKIIFLNGIHAGLEDTLEDGDRLAIFPPIAGG